MLTNGYIFFFVLLNVLVSTSCVYDIIRHSFKFNNNEWMNYDVSLRIDCIAH